MAFPTTYHEDSDADDEYERSMTSPHLAESEASPTDSDPRSAEHTPTLYGNFGDDRSPSALITDWSADEVADYISTLGLSQYVDAILDNEVVGEALIALRHEELKELGMISMGHRLTVLKSVYDIKKAQGVSIEPEHYVPMTAETTQQDATATREDITRIIQSIKLRDQRIIAAEQELQKVTEDYRKLREELLPVFRMAKDKSHPLPFHPGDEPYDQVGSTPQPPPWPERNDAGQKQPIKRLSGANKPIGSSPTYFTSSQENKSPREVGPSIAAVTASNHLTATVNGGSSSNSPGANNNMPSPTSPPHQNTLQAGRYRGDPPSARSAQFGRDESWASSAPTIIENGRGSTSGTSRRQPESQAEPPGSAGLSDRNPPSVEIFKSFRVGFEDPCYKVLPAALKKYNINADWKQYALYIVYGDQERCLGLNEKPLILFKQLDKEGKKPMFMLRKHAAPAEGHSATYNPDAGHATVSTPGGVL